MDHSASWRERVVRFGWRVKKGGKVYWGGYWKSFEDGGAVVETGRGVAEVEAEGVRTDGDELKDVVSMSGR